MAERLLTPQEFRTEVEALTDSFSNLEGEIDAGRTVNSVGEFQNITLSNLTELMRLYAMALKTTHPEDDALVDNALRYFKRLLHRLLQDSPDQPALTTQNKDDLRQWLEQRLFIGRQLLLPRQTNIQVQAADAGLASLTEVAARLGDNGILNDLDQLQAERQRNLPRGLETPQERQAFTDSVDMLRDSQFVLYFQSIDLQLIRSSVTDSSLVNGLDDIQDAANFLTRIPGVEERPLGDEGSRQIATLTELLYRATRQKTIFLNSPEQRLKAVGRELEKLERLIHQMLHENRVINLGQRTDRSLARARSFLRPSLRFVDGRVAGEMQQFVGNFADQIDNAEILGMILARAAKAGGNVQTALNESQRHTLEELRRRVLDYREDQGELRMPAGMVMDAGDIEKFNAFLDEVEVYVQWLDRMLDTTDPSGGAPGGAPPEDGEDGLENERTPGNYLAAYLEYYRLATGRLIGKIKTNVEYGEWPPKVQVAYQRYEKLQPTGDELAADPLWTEYNTLIDNVGASWEYEFMTIKSGTAGLVHDKEKIEIFVSPQRWRNVFRAYELVAYEPHGPTVKGDQAILYTEASAPTPERIGTQMGPFWDMWYTAIQVAVNPEGPEEKKFEYGDNFANNAGSFYDFVIDKYLATPEGAAYRAQFADESLWELVRIQIKDMFNIGCLYDEIYAILAAHGASIGHSPTVIELGGEAKVNKPLWAIVRPIHYASYLANNPPDARSHEVMNLGMAPVESLDLMYQRARDRYAKLIAADDYLLAHPDDAEAGHGAHHDNYHLPPGTRDIHHAMELYVDASLDQELILGKFENPNAFPNLAQSIFTNELAMSSRYFDVDVQGWGWMWSKLWEPFDALSENQAFRAFVLWAKEGLGKAKLIKGAIERQDFVDLSSIYVARVFSAYKENKIADKGWDLVVRTIGQRMGLSNVDRRVNALRKRTVDGIKKATTVSYLGEGGPIPFKRAFLELLNVDFVHEIDDSTLPDGERLRVRSNVIKPRAPELIIRFFRRREVATYVEYMWHHHEYQDFWQRMYETKEKAIAALSADGLVKHMHPPYLADEKEGEGH